MLTAVALKKLAPRARPYKVSDGRGLYVIVRPNGAIWWRLDYRFAGKRRTLAFGVYDDVELAEARERRDQARRLLRDGKDPSAERAKDRARTDDVTFGVLADAWIEKQRRAAAPRTTKKRLLIYVKHLKPHLGHLRAREIEPRVLLPVIRKIESRRRLETAKRARIFVGQVLRYGIAEGHPLRDSAADIIDALEPVVVRHHAAVRDPKHIGALVAAIERATGLSDVVRLALRLQALVFLRPGELRGGRWAEIDFEARLWRIPAERMKMRLPHLVPLSRQAIAVLKELQAITGLSEFIVASPQTPKRPISDAAMNTALNSLGYPSRRHTPHGFRTMASTCLNELGVNADWIEMQLAHRAGGVRGIYNQAKYLVQRQRIMQKWADYLDARRREVPGA